MIDRIFLAKLSDSSTAASVAADLRGSLGSVEGASEVQVGLPADHASARSWDVSLIFSCETAEQLGALLVGETFGRAFAQLEQASEVVKAWSFERT